MGFVHWKQPSRDTNSQISPKLTKPNLNTQISPNTHSPKQRYHNSLCKTYHLHMTLRGEQGGGWHKMNVDTKEDTKTNIGRKMNNYETRPAPRHSWEPLKFGGKSKIRWTPFSKFTIHIWWKLIYSFLLPNESLRERWSEKLIYSEMSYIYVHFSILQNSVLSFIVPSFRMRPLGGRINYLEVLLQIHNFNLMLHKRYRGEINQTSKH